MVIGTNVMPKQKELTAENPSPFGPKNYPGAKAEAFCFLAKEKDAMRSGQLSKAGTSMLLTSVRSAWQLAADGAKPLALKTTYERTLKMP